MGASNFFMINDPSTGAGVQKKSRYIFVQNNGAIPISQRSVDNISNGDSVPTSVVSFTQSTGTSLATLAISFNPEIQRLVIGLNGFPNIGSWIKYSDNYGVSWATGSISTRQTRGLLYTPDFGSVKMIAAGITGTGAPFTGQVHTSQDSINYTLAQSFSGNIFPNYGAYSPSLRRAVFTNGGTSVKNCCYWSDNGSNWFAGTFSGASFNPGEGVIIWQSYWNTFLVGRGGTNNTNCLALSTDGQNWSPITATGMVPIGSTINMYALAHNPYTGRTIAAQFSGAAGGAFAQPLLYYSDNGGTIWTRVVIPSAAYFFYFAHWDENTDMFIVGLAYNPASTTRIGWFMSSDGINWTYFAAASPNSAARAPGIPYLSFPLP